jgi:hypothetical protein
MEKTANAQNVTFHETTSSPSYRREGAEPMICPCDGQPMRFPECQRCLHECLAQVFQMADRFRVVRDGEGIKVEKGPSGEGS